MQKPLKMRMFPGFFNFQASQKNEAMSLNLRTSVLSEMLYDLCFWHVACKCVLRVQRIESSDAQDDHPVAGFGFWWYKIALSGQVALDVNLS